MVAVRQTPSSIGSVDCADVEVRRMKHEAPARLDRSAHQHLHRPTCSGKRMRSLLGTDLELNQQIRHRQVGRGPVEDDAHRAFRRMCAEIDYRPGETLVRTCPGIATRS